MIRNRTGLAIAGLLALVLLVGAGNLWATYSSYHHFQGQYEQTQRTQQRQGQVVIGSLCSTFGKLAELKPPPGNPANNPSRAYAQQQHDILAGVPADIHCPA